MSMKMMRAAIWNITKTVVLMSFLCTCSAVVLPSPVLEASTFQNETAIQVDWQFESDQPVSNFIVMSTGKFFDNVTREEMTEGSVRSFLLTQLKSGETYIIAVVVVNATESSTSRELEVNTNVFAADIEVVSSSLFTLSFRWSLPAGERANSFKVYLTLEGTLQEQNLDGDTFDVTFYNLTSSNNYDLLVYNYGYNGLNIFSSSYYSTDIPDILTGFLSIHNTYFTIYWWGKDQLYLPGPFLVEYQGQNIDTLKRNKTVESTRSSTDITELPSGETYIATVSMSTKVSTKTSNLTYVTTALNAPTFNDRSQTMTTLTFTWSSNNGFVEFFQLQYGGVELETTQQTWNVSGSDLETTITELVPGVEYRVKIVAISNTQTSPSDTLRISTMPGPVENLRVTFNDAGHLRADWDPPSVGYVENYEVEIHNSTTLILTDDLYATGYEYFDPDLEEMYTVYVTSLAKDGERSTKISTHTGVTASVADVAHYSNETSIRLTWTPPTDTFTLVRVTCTSCVENGVQDFYINDMPVCVYTSLAPGSSHFIFFETFLNEESISPTVVFIISTIPKAPTIAVPSTDDIGLDFIVLSLSDATCSGCAYRGQATSELGQTPDPVLVTPGSSQTTIEMRFESLEPGTRYTISIQAEVNLVTSPPAEIDLQTDLAMATDFTWNVNTSAISLSWTPPRGLYDVVKISCACGQTYTVGSDAAPLVIFSGVDPGASYFISIESMREGFRETRQEIIHIYTAPELPNSFEVPIVESTSLTFHIIDYDCSGCTYTVTAMSSDSVNHTVVMHDRVASDTVFTIEMNDLTAGTDYFVQLVVSINGLESPTLNKTVTTKPESLTDVRFAQVTSTSFNVYWDTPEGNIDGYILMLEPPHIQVSEPSHLAMFYQFENLQPYTVYNVTLSTLAGSKISDSIVGTVTTLQGTPGPVTNIDVQLSQTSAILRFDPPSQVYGVLEGYFISQIGHFTGLPTNREHRSIGIGTIINVFENLLLGYNYTYNVQAKNANNFGVPTFTSIIVPPNEPEPSNVRPKQVPESAITNSSFTVVVNYLLFVEDNGPVSTFIIIVAEQQAIGDSVGGETGDVQGADLPSWGQSINTIPTPRYQISEPLDYSIIRNVDSRKKREAGFTINIGSENCSSSSATNYCNGPLKPGKTYVYQFRGYYNTDFYADTLYSEPITLKDNGSTPKQTEEDNKVVVITVVLGVVILLLVGFIIILVYSYRTKNKVLRTIVGKDGTFRETSTTRQDVNLVSMKLKPEERWDLNFAQFESTIIQEQRGSTNISVENIAEISNGHAETEEFSQDDDKTEETSFVADKTEETSFVVDETEETSLVHDKTEETSFVEDETEETSFVEEKTEESSFVEDNTEQTSVITEQSTELVET